MATLVANNESARITLVGDAAGNVTFQVTKPIAQAWIDLDLCEPSDRRALEEFLSVLSSQQVPWVGPIGYDALDGSLSLELSCDPSGHVTAQVSLDSHGCRLETALLTELGQVGAFGRDGLALLGHLSC